MIPGEAALIPDEVAFYLFALAQRNAIRDAQVEYQLPQLGMMADACQSDLDGYEQILREWARVTLPDTVVFAARWLDCLTTGLPGSAGDEVARMAKRMLSEL